MAAATTEVPVQKQSVAKDLFAGTMGGIAQVFVGQPFDIVKVRLQSSDAYSGAMDCATRIAREEGLLAFYKGTAMPLLGIGACVSLQFACLGACKNYFIAQNKRRGITSSDLSYGQLYLAGAGAGIGNSIVSGPVEHIRIRMQTQTKLAAGAGPGALAYYYNGPFDAVRKIWAADGLKGIFYGQGSTLLREIQAYGMYFMAYEALVQRKCRNEGITRKDLTMVDAVSYGALAGYALWFTAYPLDAIKSKIQTDGFPSQAASGKKKYNGVLDCVRKTYAAQGYRGFFKGLIPTLIRSPFANGATFAAFELTMRFIS